VLDKDIARMMNYYVIIHVTFSQESLSPAVCLQEQPQALLAEG